MFRTVCTAVGAAFAAAAVSGAAMAQDKVADGAIRPVAAGASAEVIKLSTVMKSKVLIQEDESAGQVVDVVLSDGGCIDYVVASYDDQYYAIPYSAVALRTVDRAIFVDITPAQFRKVTFFSANQWPNFYASSFQRGVFSVFGVNTLRNDGAHRTAKPNLDRSDDRANNRDDRRDDRANNRDDRRDDARDNRDDRRDDRVNNRDDRRDDLRDNRSDAKDDRRNRNDEGTAGERGTDKPRDRVPDRNANPNERRDPKASDKDSPPKPDLKGLTPKSGDSKPKADLPKADKPKSAAPKPIAPGTQPKPKEKKNP